MLFIKNCKVHALAAIEICNIKNKQAILNERLFSEILTNLHYTNFLNLFFQFKKIIHNLVYLSNIQSF